MTLRIDGRAVADQLRQRIVDEGFRQKPGLAILQVGEHPESALYVRLKQKAAEGLGMHFEHHLLADTSTQEDVVQLLQKLNAQEDIHGIVVQLPLPATINTTRVLSSVALEKDVDGLHPDFQSAVREGKPTSWLPALQMSILRLLEAAGTTMKDTSALVVAKSEDFRATTKALLEQRGASVSTVKDDNAALTTLATAMIVITALGKPGWLKEALCASDATVIDVATTKTASGVVGDFLPDGSNRIAAYSPVPGGIGPVTVMSLLLNTITAMKQQGGKQ